MDRKRSFSHRTQKYRIDNPLLNYSKIIKLEGDELKYIIKKIIIFIIISFYLFKGLWNEKKYIVENI